MRDGQQCVLRPRRVPVDNTTRYYAGKLQRTQPETLADLYDCEDKKKVYIYKKIRFDVLCLMVMLSTVTVYNNLRFSSYRRKTQDQVQVVFRLINEEIVQIVQRRHAFGIFLSIARRQVVQHFFQLVFHEQVGHFAGAQYVVYVFQKCLVLYIVVREHERQFRIFVTGVSVE